MHCMRISKAYTMCKIEIRSIECNMYRFVETSYSSLEHSQQSMVVLCNQRWRYIYVKLFPQKKGNKNKIWRKKKQNVGPGFPFIFLYYYRWSEIFVGQSDSWNFSTLQFIVYTKLSPITPHTEIIWEKKSDRPTDRPNKCRMRGRERERAWVRYRKGEKNPNYNIIHVYIYNIIQFFRVCF